MDLLMRHSCRLLMVSLVIGSVMLHAGAQAAEVKEKPELKEEEIALEKVPKVVLTAIKKKFPDAKLQGAAKQTEDDQVSYEILIKHKGHEMYVVCEPDGKIVEIDREISANELPKPVTEAIKKKYAKSSIMSVGEVTEDDEITYDVLLKHGKKTLRVIFDPKGKVLEEEPADERK
jgi:hypothetical protein